MTISCQVAAALAVSGATQHVLAGRADLQDTTDVSAGVSERPHHETQQRADHCDRHRLHYCKSFQTNDFWQTFLQHCSTIRLQLSTNVSSEL